MARDGRRPVQRPRPTLKRREWSAVNQAVIPPLRSRRPRSLAAEKAGCSGRDDSEWRTGTAMPCPYASMGAPARQDPRLQHHRRGTLLKTHPQTTRVDRSEGRPLHGDARGGKGRRSRWQGRRTLHPATGRGLKWTGRYRSRRGRRLPGRRRWRATWPCARLAQRSWRLWP